MLEEIRGLYDYTDWANGRMVASIRGLTDEQVTRPLTSSFPTIGETLAHIASAEWIWLQRWNGTSPTAAPDWSVGADPATLQGRMAEVSSVRREFLGALTTADLRREVEYRTLSGDRFTNQLLDILFHVANHSTYHRGQLTTMLRQVGAVPPTTDLIVFRREQART